MLVRKTSETNMVWSSLCFLEEMYSSVVTRALQTKSSISFLQEHGYVVAIREIEGQAFDLILLFKVPMSARFL